MFSRPKIANAHEAINSMDNLDDLTSYIKKLPNSLGIANIAYHLTHIPGHEEKNPIVMVTYNREWVDTYYANDYFSIDPVVLTGPKEFLPLDWQTVDRRSSEAEHFFQQAKSYEVGNQGLTIPIKGHGGERALFSFTTEDADDAWAANKLQYLQAFHYLAHLIHDKAVTLGGYRHKRSLVRLSRRERECIEEIISGKTPKQIAIDRHLSMTAVRQYLQSAKVKIGANSIAQAAVLFLQQTIL